MPTSSFSIKYDGPALANGEMPVRDLAPSLLALGNLFTEASEFLYPDQEPVALNIKATEDGSFFVQLILHSDPMWDQIVRIFGSRAISALVNLKELLIVPGVGLLWFCKRMRDRTISAEEPSETPGNVRLTLDDETSLEVPMDVVRLWRNTTIRKETREVVTPLTRTGVVTLTIDAPEASEPLLIERADVPAYTPPKAEEQQDEGERITTVEIVAPSFHSASWRLSEGGPSFWATIEDDAFLARVKSRAEAFRAGDLLRCRLRIVQRLTPEGLDLDIYVAEVLRHIESKVQLTIEESDKPTSDASNVDT